MKNEEIDYEVPPILKVDQKIYDKWLQRKVSSLQRRNKKKDGLNCGSTKEYKEAIHRAVDKCEGRDHYTGEWLDWSLLGKYNNKEAQKGGIEYMRKFKMLPTVDHYNGRKNLDFVICSWIVNDSKNHLSHNEFIGLCENVIKYHKKNESHC